MTAKLKRALLSIALVFCTTGAVFAQTERVILPGESLTGAEIFDEIERQAGFRFGYDKAVFDGSTAFRLTRTESDVRSILAEMFRDKPVEYKFQGKLVLLFPRVAFSLRNTSAARQPRTGDVYLYNPEGSVTAAPLPRPEIVRSVPEPVTVEKFVPREFPPSTSAYIPPANYLQSYQSHPAWGIKTNLLYAGAFLTPNLAFEFGIAPKSTLALSGSYTWYGRDKETEADTKQFVHSVFAAEYRYWFCERFNGLFIGGHALYARYNVGDLEIPMLFKKSHRYDGHAYGAGVSVGYHWAFAKRWGLEFTAGVGYAYMKYDRFDCAVCDREAVKKTKNYFGPTKLGINLVFLIK